MKVWVSPYELVLKHDITLKRRGFLLRVQTNDFEFGYGDCFSWPELGDPSIKTLLQSLAENHEAKPCLLQRSLESAVDDGRARELGQFLLRGQESLSNHFLSMTPMDADTKTFQNISDLGFKAVKIKVQSNQQVQLARCLKTVADLANGLRLRIDFNGGASDDFLPILKAYQKFIEFIEDPFSQVDARWTHWYEATAIPLALDFAEIVDEGLFQISICKPARSRRLKNSSTKRVFTSYLGHPVGQAHDLAFSLKAGAQQREYGLMSHLVYQPNIFSKNIINQGPSFQIPGTSGIGFDQELEAVSWTQIL